MKNNIAIVGAGPSGICCALNILTEFKNNNFSDFHIDIIDKSSFLKTIIPTGGGRCNITSSIDDIDLYLSNYLRGEFFLKSIFSRYFIYDTLSFFSSIGIDCFEEENNRIFPKSESSKDVKDKMIRYLNLFSSNYSAIKKEIKSRDDLANYDYIIISAGSKGTDDLILSFNHNLIPFRPALASLVVNGFSDIKGVSVKSLDGEFVFTDKGISGPLAFKLSSLNNDKTFPFIVNIKLFSLEDVLNLIKIKPKKTIGNIISEFIPKSLARKIVLEFDKKASEVSKKTIENYSILKLEVKSFVENSEMVRSGGVDLSELDKNCKSLKYNNLWYIGEILNIDGFTGGFNLQNCWSTGAIAARDVVNRILKEEK